MENKKRKIIPMKDWYMTFMYMNIPIIGWIYLLILALRKDKINDNIKSVESKKIRSEFAKAFLLYKLTILITCILLIILLINMAIPYIERLLTYIEML